MPQPGDRLDLSCRTDQICARRASEDTFLRALVLWSEGETAAAEVALGDLLRRDLRCLEAHSCLGFFTFNGPPQRGGGARAGFERLCRLNPGDQLTARLALDCIGRSST